MQLLIRRFSNKINTYNTRCCLWLYRAILYREFRHAFHISEWISGHVQKIDMTQQYRFVAQN
jgi:hypothetical protein